MRHDFPRKVGSILSALSLALLVLPMFAGEMPPDEQAKLVLNAARKAYNEQNYPFAIERFREFLQRFGGHKDAVSARYGMALALLEGPARDYQNAMNELGQVVGNAEFAERPYALHYMGVARRGLGYRMLAEADAKPNEAQNFRNQARPQFEEAGRSFAAAADLFAQRVQAAPAPAAGAPPNPELDWAARSRCDQAEMLLRTDKFKEAADLAAALLADPVLGKTQYRALALYHLGYAKFALREYLEAGRALSQLAPFQHEFGIHARYLLARTHHLAGERAEAANQYKAVLAAYDEHKKAAQAALGNPAALRNDQREFLEALVRNPPPEHVIRSLFYLALIQAEDGRFAEALAGFTALLQQFPQNPLVPEAQLRVGFCQMQLKNFPEAIKNLQPLAEHPQLGDQALWWLARSQVGAADPNNAPAYEQAVRGAIELLRRAADRANQLAQNDPIAKLRRGDILLEMADTQQLARMFREAAGTYAQVLNEKLNPDRAEEALQRQVTALHLGGMYRESDEAAQRFEQTFPKSTLLPAVLFRAAENAFMAASTAKPGQVNPQDLAKQFTEAIARYQRLLQQFPEFQFANLARHGMGASHYHLGQYAQAIEVLSAIPEMERTGDLALVSYLLADCLIRTLPPEADDALLAAKLIEQCERAAKLLEGFVAANPKSAQAPDAMLKLGYCQQRIGAVLVEPAERQKLLGAARQVYESFMQQFPQDPAMPSAVFERAKCLALLGDPGNAMNELGRFRGDPFRNAPVAPLALVRLSSLMRAQGRAPEAMKLMEECRGQHEERVKNDPARSSWVPLIQYEHALAVKEAGKLPEARAVFDQIAKQFPGSPEAVNAQWRAGQCLREELVASMAAAKANATKPGAKPDEIAAAKAAIEQGLKGIAGAVEFLRAQADELGKKAPGSEAGLRALYELAWCYRVLADAEIEAARLALQADAVAKTLARLGKPGAAALNPGEIRPPDFPLTAIPAQPSEKLAHETYARLIAAAPDAVPAIQARLELAELRAGRANPDGALELLAEALEKNPPLELAERIRLRLATLLLARNDAKAALAQVQAVAKNQATPFAGEVRYLAGEALLQQADWPKAIEQLLPFRDNGQFHNIPGVSDRAVLRLGHAFAQAGQWDQCRNTLDALVNRYPNSPWADEGRYQLGWAWQMMKQLDQAVNQYALVTRCTVSIFGAKAQLQIGLCRLEQKNYPEAAKALLAVPYTYDYPELNGQALCQAALAYIGLNQPDEAAKLWQRVAKEFPGTEWAKAAEQGLAALKPAAEPPKK
ncbi:MAG TPA: tetratricopeptide repeat protein [Planctomycetota bacterium]|nr:tetratricopeptide repeat protein [Planctomycetota bacterium]HRR79236.1 tetratricopeptide repeat protein [Planctomycetota bacterium]